jgi:hypothetical protein
LEALFNQQFNHARILIENNFKNLKKSFQELMIKSNLDVQFFLDVVVCCCLLHNGILNKKNNDINELVQQLELEDAMKTKHGMND